MIPMWDSTKPKILIVEDELIIAEDLVARLERQGFEVLGIATSANETIRLLKQQLPDLMLMDIHLEGQPDGIELARQVSEEWSIPFIFLTAHADEATYSRALPTQPIAYLLKPFNERELVIALKLALQRVRQPHNPTQTNSPTDSPETRVLDNIIYIRKRGRFEKIQLDDVLYIEASGNSVELFTTDRNYIVSETLSNFTELLGSNRFVRIHRSYAVNIDRIDAIEEARLFIGTKELPISKSYRSELQNRVRFF